MAAPARKLFYSYSHRDEKMLLQLVDHLASLRREGLIDDWSDRALVGGEEWDEELRNRLEIADVVLLLVSSSFIASKFCWDVEMTGALARHAAGSARVVPIITRPTDWANAPFAKLQVLPRDARPITSWSNRDEAWLNVADGLRAVIAAMATSGTAATKAPSPARRRPARATAGKSSTAGGAAADGASGRAVSARTSTPTPGRPQRRVFDAAHRGELPGRLVRSEGEPLTGDESADRAYDLLGDAYRFLWEVFGLDSFDGRGAHLMATVHFERNFANAFWDGQQVVLGDGDDRIADLARCFDVTVKEVMNGVVQGLAGLDYQGQSGALYNASAVIFTVLTWQWTVHQTSDEADWLFGRGFWAPGITAVALNSLSAPGTAYDDETIGKDPQAAHMDHFVDDDDRRLPSLYANSGIPAHAFYLLATALGGRAWERAGRIWFEALKAPDLPRDASFGTFAGFTATVAAQRHGPRSPEVRAVRRAWTEVGVEL